MKRTVIVTLEVEFGDLSGDARKAIAKETEEHPDELPGLVDYEASELAEPFGYLETAIDTEEFLAGSDIMASITASQVIECKFKEADEQ
ncbi:MULTISPECIES: hypothetical protein [Thalassospira]|uniref:hypothetical protein n=1 Tax=Thalassospira TaxID=168934 RepID=UPI00080FEE3C|nr:MULTISPECIES: hypothetical protein [Thalassospira]OCK08624.1 hypothetical protein KO164_2803 [Thalassospira sp. KO164]OCK10324.1 hypothetical protein KO164_0029 [Thalassospira sp. KO164]SEC85973.1 hypothetical protein SAMN04515623_0028 [Thalassospira permensis]SEE53509.1 hypothetical protein SAMN04515623_2832 [Thalassospira permensis]